jgi:hypothetical protein
MGFVLVVKSEYIGVKQKKIHTSITQDPEVEEELIFIYKSIPYVHQNLAINARLNISLHLVNPPECISNGKVRI